MKSSQNPFLKSRCQSQKPPSPDGSGRRWPQWTWSPGKWKCGSSRWRRRPPPGGWCRSRAAAAGTCASSSESPASGLSNRIAMETKINEELTWPLSSNWLLVSLSLSKETTCFIHCAPWITMHVYRAGSLESCFIHLEILVYYMTKRKSHLSRRIWVNMDPWRRVGIGLASHHPAWCVECVPDQTIVRHDICQKDLRKKITPKTHNPRPRCVECVPDQKWLK